MSYDSLHRPYATVFNGTQSNVIYYSFDNNGNLLSLWNQNGTVSYTYDSRNRVLTEDYSFTYSSFGGRELIFNYTYSGETLSRIIYPDYPVGLKVNYTYDALGRVTRTFTPGNSWNYAMLYYYPTDRVRSITYGNNLYANYTYDSMSRPSIITLTKPGTPSTTLLSLSYNYTNTGTVSLVKGQVNGITDNEQYAYDNLQRLTNATLTKGSTQTTLAYQYDWVGNRFWQKQNGAVTTYSYNNANNQLTSSTSGSTITRYSYDRNGNLLTKNVTAGGTSHWVYKWDPAGYLDKVSNDNGVQGVYLYDGNNRLVGSLEGGCSFYGYLGTETLSQGICWTSSVDYVFAGGIRIAKITGSTVNYYHADMEGSTRLVTSSTGSVLFADTYLPFGQDNGTPTGSETNKFTGKPVSATTGLYYEYSRWYDASIGRFISQDSYPGYLPNPQSLNHYVYVQNQPTVLTDPTGACPEGGFWSFFCQGGTSPDDSTYSSNGDSSNPETRALRQRICPQNPYICGVAGDQSLLDTGATGSSGEATNPSPPMTTDTTPGLTPTISDVTPTTGVITDTGVIPPSVNIESLGATDTGYKFVSTPDGNLIRVPENWDGRIANNGRGLVFQDPEATGNANMIRIMDPTPAYPQGYAV
jgi:RHS repeat-associated protein